MAAKVPAPKFVLDETGKKLEVIISISDYERLLAAWEEVADAIDFQEARESAGEFISAEELSRQVLGKK